MGLDKRIGRHFLNAGVGYGGSCFPKDVAALYKTSTDQAYDFKLLRSVMEVNQIQRSHFVRKVTRKYGTDLNGKVFGCLGLAFKNDTDDIRESVAIEIVRALRSYGASVRVYDPAAMENAKKALGDLGVEYCTDEYETMKGADALIILTEWKQFAGMDLEKAKSLLKHPVIFDGRNLLDKEKVQSAGFTFFAVGKRTNGLDKFNQEDSSYMAASAVLKNGNGNGKNN